MSAYIFEIQRSGDLADCEIKMPATANANDAFWAEMHEIEDTTDEHL